MGDTLVTLVMFSMPIIIINCYLLLLLLQLLVTGIEKGEKRLVIKFSANTNIIESYSENKLIRLWFLPGVNNASSIGDMTPDVARQVGCNVAVFSIYR